MYLDYFLQTLKWRCKENVSYSTLFLKSRKVRQNIDKIQIGFITSQAFKRLTKEMGRVSSKIDQILT